MAWKPKLIDGGRSEGKTTRPIEKGSREAFTLGGGGFKKADTPTGDALWNFLDLDTKRKD